jgi:hypothetical protein
MRKSEFLMLEELKSAPHLNDSLRRKIIGYTVTIRKKCKLDMVTT